MEQSEFVQEDEKDEETEDQGQEEEEQAHKGDHADEEANQSGDDGEEEEEEDDKDGDQSEEDESPLPPPSGPARVYVDEDQPGVVIERTGRRRRAKVKDVWEEYMAADRLLDCHNSWFFPALTIGSRSNYGRIYEACRDAEERDCPYIVKIVRLDDKDKRASFYRDVYFLSVLQDVQTDNGHRVVPRLITKPWTCERAAKGIILMEQMKTDLWRSMKAKVLEMKYVLDAVRTLWQLTVGGRHIYHGDVSLTNLMLDRHDRVRLVDFGLASDIDNTIVEQSPFALGPSLPWRKGGRKVSLLTRGQNRFFDPYINIWAFEVYLLCQVQSRQITIQDHPNFAGFDVDLHRDRCNIETITHILVQDGLVTNTQRGQSLRFYWEEYRQKELRAHGDVVRIGHLLTEGVPTQAYDMTDLTL